MPENSSDRALPPELEPEELLDELLLDVEELLLDDEVLEDELPDDVDDELLEDDVLEEELPEAELPPPPPDEQPANSIARLSSSNKPACGDRVIFNLRNS